MPTPRSEIAARERFDQAVPEIRYPDLPISRRREDIAAAIHDHQVVVITGETGSGKTTQLPKICLELGRGVTGMIGHTQPRRLAARTVAERIAEELGTELGGLVGWKVRFTDKVGGATKVKLMTDGILLAEIQSDRRLRQYDTIIIDEAHERSLNIDFLLGYLKRLLPRRPDLKVIITSATIDPERFAEHFDQAPIVEVSGRSYPVEMRYRPYGESPEDDRDQTQAICDAVDELCGETFGDILVFLSGEREIRDTADALNRQQRPETEIVPLFARLSAAEQHRVFAPHSGRRIVLATNVAETSLTVPGIRYVIDPGTARISRYSRRLKVQRLPIEPVSRASANQRAGRCGRLADGICIRLYSEDDFDARPEFTEPEIVRTNLASVILQMTALGLGDIAGFPFVDPPDRRQIADGVQLLGELGALDKNGLTPTGRTLARLPVDPRLGRMLVAADRNGCLREVLVIAAALSIQDPRERPTGTGPDRGTEQQADAKHARFAEPTSDFVSYLNLWNYLREQQGELSSSAFRRLCRAEYLHYLRVREWQDLHSQLRQVTRGLGMTVNAPSDEPNVDSVHRSLLAGLLSHVGLFDPETRDYLGARGARFAVFPGSALFRKPPRWVMSAELVETTRLWARTCARIDPDWIEPLAEHLVKRNYSEPHWERRRGAVVALEKVTLYGVPIVTGRKVNFSRIDPELCRELFIRHALVEGDWDTRHEFFRRNRELLDDVEELEHRARRRDILVDDQTLFDFYDERIPADVVSAGHFDSWWRRARRSQPELLTFTPELVVAPHASVSERDYPDRWPVGDVPLPLRYQFEPGSDADGVTVDVPLAVLNRLQPEQFSWQVPGLREELVIALLKSLPKQLRRAVVPMPDTARDALRRLTPYTGWLADELSRDLGLPRDQWDQAKVPGHLKITFRVLDGDEVAARGKDLDEIVAQLRPTVEATISAVVGEDVQRQGMRAFDVDAVPRVVRRTHGDHTLTGYPALVDEGDSVAVRVLPTEDEQRRAMWLGTRRLLLLGTPSPVKLVLRSLDNAAKLDLSANPHGGVAAMLADCVDCAADAVIAAHGGPAWDRAGFEPLRKAMAAQLGPAVLDVLADVRRILTAWRAVRGRLASLTADALRPSVDDMRGQLESLVYPGFIAATGRRRLADVARYLQALERRLEGLQRDPQRDRSWTLRVQAVTSEYEQLRRELPRSDALDDIRWMIEELRVSLFAQTLRTPYPISEKRIHRAIDALLA